MNCSRQRKLKPVLRICAAISLFVWLAALIACSTECREDSHSESAEMDQAAASSSQSHDSDKHENHDDSFCVSLHSLCPPAHQPVLTKPDFCLAFTLHFLATANLEALASDKTPIFRQPPDRQFVFMHEVCLGAACRSLAPPVISPA